MKKQTLPAEGFTRARDLIQYLPFSKATLWSWSKSGRFPKPVKISPTITAWKNSDVLAWLESQSKGGAA